jgi:hypothetical protein
MDAIEFVSNYETYLTEIEQVVKPEYFKTIQEMRDTDPHNLIHPDTILPGVDTARGYVWKMFLKKIKKTK